MKLVSAAKLKRAQDAALNGRHFTEELLSSLESVLGDLSVNFTHPVLPAHNKVRRRRIIVVGGERGLCGPYNTNLVRAVLSDTAESELEYEFIPIGRRMVAAAKRFNWNVIESFESLADDATEWPMEELVERCVKDFVAGEYDELCMYFTRFASAVSQAVTMRTLLPMTAIEEQMAEAFATETRGLDLRLKYDPLPEEMFEKLYPLTLLSFVRLAGLESKASEHAARMTAMDAATNNASELLEKLKLFYNRARQSAITTELMDVIGGAEALE
jgi:F-type H+-transporting ATPase subunit gamma